MKHVHGEIASARLPCAMLEDSLVGMVGTGLRNPFRVSLVLLFSKVSSVSSAHKPPLRAPPKTTRELEKLRKNEDGGISALSVDFQAQTGRQTSAKDIQYGHPTIPIISVPG